MGNRAVIVFKGGFDKTGVQPAIYVHWHGHKVRDLLLETNKVMVNRDDDAQYSSARFCQIAARGCDGNLSIGLTTADLDNPEAASHGDAGVFVVDVSKRVWQITNYDGSEEEGAFSGPIGEEVVDECDEEKDWTI